MAKIITVGNQKGGVTKTTTAWALAAGLKNKGRKVLAIDLDPQGNLSKAFGADKDAEVTSYEVMKDDAKTEDGIQHLNSCDVIAAPRDTALAGIELEVTHTGKEYRLREKLTEIDSDYDYIIIDTPPNLGMLTINAFTASHKVIIPSTAASFSTDGMIELNKTIINVKKYCNPSLAVDGILMAAFNPQANIHKAMREVTALLAEQMGTKMYQTFIRRGIAIEEAQAQSISIFDYDSKSTVAEDYNTFIDEFLKGAES